MTMPVQERSKLLSVNVHKQLSISQPARTDVQFFERGSVGKECREPSFSNPIFSDFLGNPGPALVRRAFLTQWSVSSVSNTDR